MTDSFKRYRYIDLSIFALLICFFETLVVIAGHIWFPYQIITLSIVPALVTIVMMRWGKYAIIHSVLGALAFCLGMLIARVNVTLVSVVVQCGGSLFVSFALIFYKYVGAKRIKENLLLCFAFAVIVYLCICVGQTVISMLYGESFLILFDFLALYSASCLFSLLAVFVTRKLDGVFENQIDYITRLEKEREKAIIDDHGKYANLKEGEATNCAIQNDNINDGCETEDTKQ